MIYLLTGHDVRALSYCVLSHLTGTHLGGRSRTHFSALVQFLSDDLGRS